jgi:hypothetical protein
LLAFWLMQSKISFLVRRVDGTTQSFSADPRRTFVEVIGVAPLSNSQLVHNGRTLNKFLTLEHENITNGSVVLVIKQNPRRHRRAHFRDAPPASTSPELELSRINDVMWFGWELSKHHNRMLNLMAQKVNDVTPSEDTQRAATIVDRAPEINTDPLPTWFGDGCKGDGLRKRRGRRKVEDSSTMEL